MYDNDSSIFQNYVALTTQKPILVSRVIDEIKKHFKTNQFAFLDIGCGDGIVTVPIINSLKNDYEKLEVICIEPSLDLINAFKKKTDYGVDFINKDVESISQLPKADFILMSHLLSYVQNTGTFLENAHQALSQNGLGLIVINNPNSDDSVIKRQLLAGKDDNMSAIIQGVLSDRSIDYYVETIDSTIDVSGVTEMDDKGKTVIEFFKHQRFNEIPEDQINELRQAVLELCNSDGKLIKREDYIWIRAA
jgi:ubiquinone/menaquinone biosynthesis C-methylase UbiE